MNHLHIDIQNIRNKTGYLILLYELTKYLKQEIIILAGVLKQSANVLYLKLDDSYEMNATA